ncbi:unnamed protein product [Calypogeia fissa]
MPSSREFKTSNAEEGSLPTEFEAFSVLSRRKQPYSEFSEDKVRRGGGRDPSHSTLSILSYETVTRKRSLRSSLYNNTPVCSHCPELRSDLLIDEFTSSNQRLGPGGGRTPKL